MEKELDYSFEDPLKRLIFTDATVRDPMTGKSMEVRCLWDTGASGTCISQTVISRLCLKPISAVMAQSANSYNRMGIFLIDLDLGPSAFNGVPVAGLVSGRTPVADIFLGMDIIGRGDMSLTHKNGKLVFHWE